jgi:hypothetical protein
MTVGARRCSASSALRIWASCADHWGEFRPSTATSKLRSGAPKLHQRFWSFINDVTIMDFQQVQFGEANGNAELPKFKAPFPLILPLESLLKLRIRCWSSGRRSNGSGRQASTARAALRAARRHFPRQRFVAADSPTHTTHARCVVHRVLRPAQSPALQSSAPESRSSLPDHMPSQSRHG